MTKRPILTVFLVVSIGSVATVASLRRSAPPVLVERPPQAVAANQAIRVNAVHKAGQTFVTWGEVGLPRIDREPGVEALIRVKAESAKRISYRIYRSTEPISTVKGLRPIGRAEPFSGWNTDFYGLAPRPEHKAFRYRIAGANEPLGEETGLYVHNPPSPGRAYYAVTRVADGVEDTAVSGANRTTIAVEEAVGPGVPILQRVEKPESFAYIAKPELQYFTRWEAPPNSNRENRPLDYLVGIPPNVKNPASVGIHLHCYGGSLQGCYGWWFNGSLGAILVSTNQLPYDWYTGYHERSGVERLETSADWQSGVVRPYTQTRLLSFVNWLATTRPIDLQQTFAAGNSMGGSGSLMLAIRHPDKIAWAESWVGVHRPTMTPTFRNSYQANYGPPEAKVKFEDGTPVWEYFDDVHYLRRHPGDGIGLLVFSNGKNDNDIGWQQAADFFRALQETRQPHVFVWGQNGHGQRVWMPSEKGASETDQLLDLRTNRSLPAFSRGSLDDDPGDGRQSDGAPGGQANLYLFWEPETIVDRVERWEVTVAVRKDAPTGEAVADVTPRRCQNFRPLPGEKLRWSNSQGSRQLQSGELTVDEHGLATIPAAKILASRNRIRLERVVSR